MASGTILGRKVTDVKLVWGSYGNSFTVSAHSGLDAYSKATMPDTPSGYISLAYGTFVEGDPKVCPVNIFDSAWIVNTSASTSSGVRVRHWKLCIKYG